MNFKDDYLKLVESAQRGDKDCMNRLSELASEELRIYIYRLTLQKNAAEDIVQETMLEMIKFLGKLEKPDSFWPWLRTIAVNKMHSHNKRQQNENASSTFDKDSGRQGNKEDGLVNLISEEVKQNVSAAMGKIKPRHRQVLVLRCYEELSYSEIAREIGCSEFGAKVLFSRAKKSLAKELARCGLGKGALLMALVIFGKMTATSEAAAATVSVTPAILKVGTGAGMAAILASKTGIVALTTAGIIAAAAATATKQPENTMSFVKQAQAINIDKPSPISEPADEVKGCWYYYPAGADGPVMLRRIGTNSNGKADGSILKQNEKGNFYYDSGNGTTHIENYHIWNSDLSVFQLPSDGPELREFISKAEGRPYEFEYVPNRGAGLLVIANKDEEKSRPQVSNQFNLLEEEYFQYNLPMGAKVVDNRDVMHKRGWTYFTVAGEIDGKKVSGKGRMPFVYKQSTENYAWLRVQIGDKEFIDTSLAGLGRPWMGLHTIDIVRRDAAQRQIPFDTKLSADRREAEVTLKNGNDLVIYTIAMKTDVIDKITFTGKRKGQLQFDYMQKMNTTGNEFDAPVTGCSNEQRKEPFFENLPMELKIH